MNPSADGQTVAVVVVTYESAGHVGAVLRAADQQLRDGDEIVVVDNASTDASVEVAREASPRARVLEQSANLGFAAGCNAGAAASSAALLLFLNPDAMPAPGCVDALRSAAGARPGWGAWQALVTLPGGHAINTSGGVTHFLGMGWAGDCGEPIEAAPRTLTETAFPSGAALCVRREAWELVGGFDDRYFMYGEDLDLGLRMWLSGRGVGVVPDARVEHDYEFAKGNRKWFFLERNRWWTILSDYPTGLLVVVLPALLCAELALLVVAARDGWLRSKLRAQLAVVGELPQILARRRSVQSTRTLSGGELAERLSAGVDNPYLGGLARARVLVALQRGYWRFAKSLLTMLERP
jgi:GT2 family glycosyltransferase